MVTIDPHQLALLLKAQNYKPSDEIAAMAREAAEARHHALEDSQTHINLYGNDAKRLMEDPKAIPISWGEHIDHGHIIQQEHAELAAAIMETNPHLNPNEDGLSPIMRDQRAQLLGSIMEQEISTAASKLGIPYIQLGGPER